jgi:Lipocalin-like domain
MPKASLRTVSRIITFWYLTGNKRGESMFYIIVILAAIFAMPAQAQSLREQLIGAWAVVSCPNDANAAIICGTNPNGISILDASGHYAGMTAARGRPKSSVSGANRDAVPADDYKAMARGVFANFGTWSVNEADKTITYHTDGALFPNAEGTDGTFNISITGDEFTTTGPRGGKTVFRRIKK